METLRQVSIPRIKVQVLTVKIVGDSPLICHRWSEGVKEALLAKHMKKAKGPRDAKDPQRDYLESLYPHPDGGYGFPARAFKQAAVSACRFAEGIKMTEARGAFHVDGDLVKIIGKPSKREDPVKIGQNKPDLRYRGEFKEWSANLRLSLQVGVLSEEQIINLLNLSGFGVGVGEWRPERNGSYGRFHVATGADAQ